MMKKRSIRTGILFALLTPVLLICAENPIYAATTQTAGSATVSYHVDPAYQVTIPVDTSMRFNETETSWKVWHRTRMEREQRNLNIRLQNQEVFPA